jgi:hypothetical protein
MLNESTVVPSTRTEWRMLVIGFDFPQPVGLARSRSAKLGLISEMTLGERPGPSLSMIGRKFRWTRCTPNCTSRLDVRRLRNVTATNRYPVFGDASVNCLTHFQKVFWVPTFP